MNSRKIGQFGAVFYLVVYVLAMVLPRKLPDEGFDSAQVTVVKRIFHEALYYSEPLEPIANFLFLIPVFAFSAWVLGTPKSPNIALIACIALSATAEFLQQVIPGRISSLRDFALNSAGAILAFLIYRVFFYTRSTL